jgi:hypothetical protein
MACRHQLLDLFGHLVSKLIRKAEAVDDERIRDGGLGNGHQAALFFALAPLLEPELAEPEEESLEDSFLEVPFESEPLLELLSDPESDLESDLESGPVVESELLGALVP